MNRKVTINLLVELGEQQASRQFIFISPQDRRYTECKLSAFVLVRRFARVPSCEQPLCKGREVTHFPQALTAWRACTSDDASGEIPRRTAVATAIALYIRKEEYVTQSVLLFAYATTFFKNPLEVARRLMESSASPRARTLPARAKAVYSPVKWPLASTWPMFSWMEA